MPTTATTEQRRAWLRDHIRSAAKDAALLWRSDTARQSHVLGWLIEAAHFSETERETLDRLLTGETQ